MSSKTGQATGTVYYSPAKLARITRHREREERAWAAKAGPVVVTRRPATTADRHPTPPPAAG